MDFSPKFHSVTQTTHEASVDIDCAACLCLTSEPCLSVGSELIAPPALETTLCGRNIDCTFREARTCGGGKDQQRTAEPPSVRSAVGMKNHTECFWVLSACLQLPRLTAQQSPTRLLNGIPPHFSPCSVPAHSD